MTLSRFLASTVDGLGLQHDLVEARLVALLPDLDEIAVGARHQAVEHLDDVDPRAERRVDRRHLEPDDAAADDQHALRDLAQLERAGRIDDARVFRHERQLHRLRARRDDRVLELHDFLAVSLAARRLHFEMVRIDETGRCPCTTSTLRAFAMPARPPVNLLTTPSLQPRSLSRSIFGLPNVMPCSAECLRLRRSPARVQQRLRRDAADVQAHAAERA